MKCWEHVAGSLPQSSALMYLPEVLEGPSMWPVWVEGLLHTWLRKDVCEDGGVLCHNMQAFVWPVGQHILRPVRVQVAACVGMWHAHGGSSTKQFTKVRACGLSELFWVSSATACLGYVPWVP